MADERRRPSIDFSEEVSGREAERVRTRADGWKLVGTITAGLAIIAAFAWWQWDAGAFRDQAAKREDRLVPSPLPKPFCAAPGAADAG